MKFLNFKPYANRRFFAITLIFRDIKLAASDLYNFLNAPMKNQQWSWGALRESDGALFLNVWADQSVKRDRSWYYRLTDYVAYLNKSSDNGWCERLRHIELLSDQTRMAPSYMILCKVKDPLASPRSVDQFDNQTLFIGGALVFENGDWWLEASKRIHKSEIHVPI